LEDGEGQAQAKTSETISPAAPYGMKTWIRLTAEKITLVPPLLRSLLPSASHLLALREELVISDPSLWVTKPGQPVQKLAKVVHRRRRRPICHGRDACLRHEEVHPVVQTIVPDTDLRRPKANVGRQIRRGTDGRAASQDRSSRRPKGATVRAGAGGDGRAESLKAFGEAQTEELMSSRAAEARKNRGEEKPTFSP